MFFTHTLWRRACFLDESLFYAGWSTGDLCVYQIDYKDQVFKLIRQRSFRTGVKKARAAIKVGNTVFLAHTDSCVSSLALDSGKCQVVAEIGEPISSLAASSPSMLHIVSAAGKLISLDVATGAKKILELKLPCAVSVSKDGLSVAVGTEWGNVVVVSANTHKQMHIYGMFEKCSTIRFDSAYETFLACSFDGSIVKLANGEVGASDELLIQNLPCPVLDFCLLKDGPELRAIIARCSDGTVYGAVEKPRGLKQCFLIEGWQEVFGPFPLGGEAFFVVSEVGALRRIDVMEGRVNKSSISSP